jgi:hypothetical protein
LNCLLSLSKAQAIKHAFHECHAALWRDLFVGKSEFKVHQTPRTKKVNGLKSEKTLKTQSSHTLF